MGISTAMTDVLDNAASRSSNELKICPVNFSPQSQSARHPSTPTTCIASALCATGCDGLRAMTRELFPARALSVAGEGRIWQNTR